MKKVLKIVILLLVYQFVLCHMSAQIELVGSFTDGMMTFYEHMIIAPMDIMYFNQYVYLFGWLVCGLLCIGKLTQRVSPKADMKGAEHGSNDFQSREEMQKFLEYCTTEVLPLEQKKNKK